MAKRPRVFLPPAGERGQALVLFVVLFSLILGIAAFSIDQGVWLGERRIAQKDADSAALAGASVYLLDTTDQPGAEVRAEAVAVKNLADVNALLTDFRGLPDCTKYNGTVLADVPSIEVDINAPTGGLFTSLFLDDAVIDELGATATACVGRPTSLQGLDPYFIAPGGISDPCFDEGSRPHIGVTCVFKTSSQPQEAGSRGNLSLANAACTDPSKSELVEQISEGSDAVCRVGDEIEVAEGNNTAANTKGIECRLLGPAASNGACPQSIEVPDGEGFCDSAFNDPDGSIPPFATPTSVAGIDDFTETFSNPDGTRPESDWVEQGGVLIANTCANGERSPRIMIFAIAEEPPAPGGGSKTIILKEFAVFYVFGCTELDGSGNPVGEIDIDCNNESNSGVLGIFVDAFVPEGGGDPAPPEEGASLSIVLVK